MLSYIFIFYFCTKEKSDQLFMLPKEWKEHKVAALLVCLSYSYPDNNNNNIEEIKININYKT
jgi:hypothetical protein